MIGALHVHSENSLHDCAIRIPELCNTAIQKGYEAVALTDHANMTGIAEFVKIAKEYNIKPIPGVELNILEKDHILHLILIAKDYEGYVGLCKIVSEAQKTPHNGIPVVSKNQLYCLFGNGRRFHGHVIASSGCENGILSLAAGYNFENTIKMEKQKIRNSDIKSSNKKKQSLLQKQNSIQIELANLEKDRKILEERTGKVFVKKEEALEKISDSPKYEAAQKELEAEKEDCRQAERELPRLKMKITRRKKRLDCICTELDQLENQLRELEKSNDDLDARPALAEDEIINLITEECKFYQNVFEDDFYIELMFHGREREAYTMPLLADAARKTGIKTVISNDVHILANTDDEILKCQIVRSLENNQWKEADSSAGFYSLKSESELMNMLSGFIDSDIITESFTCMHQIFDQCNFEWPKEKHYPKYVDTQGRTSEQVLETEARNNISRLYKAGEWTPEHEERLRYELPIIQNTGYADYTLIISEILAEGRKGRGDKLPGCFIGPGRGSGAGSIVNYLMGITHIDPLQYDLIFERYLNIERISPPDIDSDIATSIRDMLVAYITKQYSKQDGQIGVCSILTKQRLTAKAAIKAAGRVISAKLYGNAAKLYAVADKISKAIPCEVNMTLARCEDTLYELFEEDIELEIIAYAKLIEGVLSGYGTHAAGLIITDNGDITEYAPVINMGTEQEPIWNIQYDKDESESIGLLKLDALGLTSLDIITNTMQRIFLTRGEKVDIDHIPFERKVFREIYAKGNTNGVFQCESPGMKKMWTQLKPDCIEDIIAGVALYRPGPMDFIPDYIKGKHNPSKIQYLTPKLKPILEMTYGTIVYQEQVMRIVRDLAGYSMGRSDLVRRAMSKKKESIMNAERQNFVYGNDKEHIKGCIANGIPEETAHKIYDLMIDFAKYAFNKSHAAAYAVVSYQTAYLKYYYPKEYLIEVMNQETMERIPLFIDECKKYGFEILAPDINHSLEGFTEYDGKIIFGLGNIKGVKKNAAILIRNRGSGYKSFADFLMTSGTNKSTTKALIQSGAFSCFGHSRTALLDVYEVMSERVKKLAVIKQSIQEKQNRLEQKSDLTKKVQKRLITGLEHDLKKQALLEKQIRGQVISSKKDDITEILAMEKAVLHTFVSVHPIDQFEECFKDTIPIGDLSSCDDVKIAGVITNLKRFVTKKKNLQMCCFDLEDRSGSVKVTCFPSQYDRYKEIIEQGKVIKILGKCTHERGNSEILCVVPNYIGLPIPKCCQTYIMVNDKNDWEQNVRTLLEQYQSKQGSQVILYDRLSGKCKAIDFYVSENIKKSDIPFATARNPLKLTRK